MEGAPPPAAEAEAEAHWRIRFRLPREAMATGTNPLLLLDELRTLGPATIAVLTGDVPSLEEIEPSDCYLHWDVRLTTKHPREIIEQVFLFVLDEMELEIEPVSAGLPDSTAGPTPPREPPALAIEPQGDVRAAKSTHTIRIPAEHLDELMDRVGELVIAQSRLKQIAAASTDGA